MFYSYCDSTPCAVRKKWHIKEDKDKPTCHVMACVMHGSFGTYQWRIQDGAFGANAPPPSRNCIQDRDILIEQSITLIKQSQCS